MPNQVRDVLSEKILRVDAAVPVADMRVAIRGRHASHVAVIAQGQCLGVSNLNDADLASDDATFGDLVHNQPNAPVSDATPLEELVRLFADSNVDSQIVQNDRGEFVGVVTRQSLLEGLLRERRQIARSDHDDSVVEQRLRRSQQIAHIGIAAMPG